MEDFVAFLKTYYADYEVDNEMKDLEDKLEDCIKKVELSTGLDRYKQFVSYLGTSSVKTAKEINSCQQKILDAAPSDERTAKLMALDTVLIQEYLDNSLETYDLCINELQNFINSASKMASYRKRQESEQMEQMEQIQQKVEEEAKKVVKKIETLLNQHVATLDKLNTKIKKLVEKQDRPSILRRILNVIFIGTLSFVFVCSVIMATAMAVPAVAAYLAAHKVLGTIIAAGGLVQTLSPAIKRARDGLDELIKKFHESNPKEVEEQKGLILYKSMQTGTVEIIIELKSIRCHVEKVRETANGVSERPPDPEELIKFKEEIKNLETEIKNCACAIKKKRAEVAAKYEELKRQVQP